MAVLALLERLPCQREGGEHIRDADGRFTEDGFCVAIPNKRVGEIDTEAVLGVLKGIWISKPEPPARVRGRIEAVLDAARAAEALDDLTAALPINGWGGASQLSK